MRKFLGSAALAAAAVAALVSLAPSANASTTTDTFTFTGNLGEFVYGPPANTVLASGSFSYDSSKTGVLSFSDLSAFSINVLGVSYNINFVTNVANDYVYFGYDTTSNSFVPAPIPGSQGTFAGISAATLNLGSGFFFDPLVSQATFGNNDGVVEEYSRGAFGTVTAFTVSQTPLPSTWTMLIAAFVGFGFLAHRSAKKSSVALAAA